MPVMFLFDIDHRMASVFHTLSIRHLANSTPSLSCSTPNTNFKPSIEVIETLYSCLKCPSNMLCEIQIRTLSKSALETSNITSLFQMSLFIILVRKKK
jgi:hypothetical protein